MLESVRHGLDEPRRLKTAFKITKWGSLLLGGFKKVRRAFGIVDLLLPPPEIGDSVAYILERWVRKCGATEHNRTCAAQRRG